MKNRLKGILFELIGQLMVPFVHTDDETWVFSSTKNEHYNYNSKYLFEYVLQNHIDKKTFFVINDTVTRRKLNKVVGPYFISTRTLTGVGKVLSARVWITSAGLPMHLMFDHKERLVINLWHGVPLKKIVLMENDTTWIKRLYVALFFSRQYSAIATTSKKLISTYANSFGVKDNIVKVLGQPRNDLLFEDNRNIFEEKFPNISGKKVLYAPTYREWETTQLFPFADFDEGKVENFLERINATIFIRFHLQNQEQTRFVETKHIRFINEDKFEDIMTVLNNFDLLVTDYSSMYIDYLLLDRPIVFLPYDLSDYSKKRGFNFDYNLVTPGEKVTDTCEHFCDVIQHNLEKPELGSKERTRVNHFFNSARNSNRERVYQYILSKLKI